MLGILLAFESACGHEGHPSPAAPLLVPPAPSATAPDARGSEANDYALTSRPNLVIARQPEHLARRTTIATDVDWAIASPGGAFAIAGTDNFTVRAAKGETGGGTLYPGGKPLPMFGIDKWHSSILGRGCDRPAGRPLAA